ncbi:3'-5' exonuclease [Phycisphaera mikurensis]|uniref:DNA 3'-5' helicase n=1 Tax=Phycisphaera mikurensis (strain NBRC 102666 / KCTC 22515 / FYK2301M01) TaxID=1142394 RepID=I0IAP0_PHYMF|nr:3'-5' exonuclease [Phycisphaera mikurensis]MBB6441677.1 hypothetical protein [Phycisphaera mikurensis]BAM02328.1 putative helicase [Phycisphaera mikurensis NBRC 102666]
MIFLLADTLTRALAKLTNQEQKRVKLTCFQLQVDPTGHGLQKHRIDHGKDPNFWSARVSRDLRLILHQTGSSLLACYAGHHDDAYAWAQRRRLETHPRTGAAQLVEVREAVEEANPRTVAENEETPPRSADSAPGVPIFRGESDERLLSFGVPEDWLPDVKAVVDEDALLALADRLPAEAAEALLSLAVGEEPEVTPATEPATPEEALAHPDARRRFHLIENDAELERALEAPADGWAVFLHPSQRRIVDATPAGPTRVAGSAGTGKTVVALHRAARVLAQRPEARVLLTTFDPVLARQLRRKMSLLLDEDARKRLVVRSLDDFALDHHEAAVGSVTVATRGMVRRAVEDAHAGAAHAFPWLSPELLESEWRDVVDAWQIESLEAYRELKRVGQRTRLGEKQREAVWTCLEAARRQLAAAGLSTMPRVYAALAGEEDRAGITHAVVDEAQDIGVAQLRYLAGLTKSEKQSSDAPDALFFAGDLNQRIFQAPFSWKQLGVDVRGRSRTLKLNYRTSHQIRRVSDRLLDPTAADVDGNEADSRGTTSAFSGPPPEVRAFDDAAAESQAAGAWIAERLAEGVPAEEIAVFTRTEGLLTRAEAAVRGAGATPAVLDGRADRPAGRVAIGPMHRAKGLEFRAVAVIACDRDVLPLSSRLLATPDPARWQDVLDAERHLLYVACTRARERLLVTAVSPASELLDELGGS